jgi:hypothetical protein
MRLISLRAPERRLALNGTNACILLSVYRFTDMKRATRAHPFARDNNIMNPLAKRRVGVCVFLVRLAKHYNTAFRQIRPVDIVFHVEIHNTACRPTVLVHSDCYAHRPAASRSIKQTKAYFYLPDSQLKLIG